MNEQLVVKNFGPIKDATVDFKRVTVFIGPTGGGKSTLAKLKDIFLNRGNYSLDESKDSSAPRFDSLAAYRDHALNTFFSESTLIDFKSSAAAVTYKNERHIISLSLESVRDIKPVISKEQIEVLYEKLQNAIKLNGEGAGFERLQKQISGELTEMLAAVEALESGETARKEFPVLLTPTSPWYCPSERVFVSALEYSWAGLLRDNIGLPKNLLDFANNFSISRKSVSELKIPFLSVVYLHLNGRDFIKIPEREEPLMLLETASGIQSVTPMLVLLEHLSRNTEQAQSFIIEEPELNLYPTAQQGLLNWLVEKCTTGENDLTITTHSPYLLAHFNLLLYAYQVAENHPDRADDVAQIVPRESWINPREFAAYHVEGQQENGVRSIVNPETGLISYNGLDSTANAETAAFEKLLDINAGLEVE